MDGSRKLSQKTKKHLRSLMHILYTCAMRWELVPITANPFGNRLIRIEKGEKKKRRSLTVAQFHTLLKHRLIAGEPFRTMVIVAICLGLRCSELFALRWSNIDWDNLTVEIRRRIVEGDIDRPKTDPSAAMLPLAADVAEALWHWKLKSQFNAPEDFRVCQPVQRRQASLQPIRDTGEPSRTSSKRNRFS